MTVNPHFPDLAPFPEAPPPMGHNRPPLDVEIVGQFNDELAKRPGFAEKIALLVERSLAAPACEDADTAGRYGDAIRQIKAAEDFIDAARVLVKQPVLTATRALDGAAKAKIEPLAEARRALQQRLDSFMAEQQRLQRVEAARRAQEAAANRPAEPEIAPAPAPVIRGDLGSRIGTRTVWHHKIGGVRKLPDDVLNHPKVVEAISSVIAARVRAGEREIKGVEIWPETVSAVR